MASILNVVTAGGFMAGLGILLAILLALARKKLYVHEDPRVDEVESMLPHSNCGACGTPGCRQFAEALVQGQTDPGQCTVGKPDELRLIADFLGVAVGEHEKRVARLACAGGSHVAHIRASYAGLNTCRAAQLVSGGGKGCVWGCLGLGDCAEVCDFHAIYMDPHSLPVVVEELCTACGDCVEVCPRQLYSLQPVSHRLWVACANREKGPAAESECELICDGCGRCVVDAPEGLIQIKNNLAVIDYTRNDLASPIAIERCPTGAIVWLDDKRGALKGHEARRVIRQQPLPLG
jgi:Na+-translocating ferredoxin:NAD+ oxidoreductase RNF subunit RnfB